MIENRPTRSANAAKINNPIDVRPGAGCGTGVGCKEQSTTLKFVVPQLSPSLVSLIVLSQSTQVVTVHCPTAGGVTVNLMVADNVHEKL